MTNLEIVEREFRREFQKHQVGARFELPPIKAYEAPAAEAWVVIIGTECWVASSDREEFVFWGPKGVEPISFELPEDWNV